MAKNQYNRQWPLAIVADLGVENMGTGNGVTAKVPQGAMVVAVSLLGVVAFDSSTTATATINDGTNTFVNAQSVATTGVKTVALAHAFYPEGGEITFSLAQTGDAATEGRAIGVVHYVQLGAGDEIMG